MDDDERFVHGRTCPTCGCPSLVEGPQGVRCCRWECFYFEDDESRELFTDDDSER